MNLKKMNKNDKRILLAFILIFSFITIYSIGSYTGLWVMIIFDGGGGEGDYVPPPPPPPPPTESGVLNPIIPNPDTDGTILLRWGALDTSILSDIYNMPMFVSYDVLRSKNGGSWITIEEDILSTLDSLSYTDIGLSDGTYEYKIRSRVNLIIYTTSFYTNIVSVVVSLQEEEEDFGFPSNPSIVINDGEETTDSFIVFLTLSCDDADTMSFKLAYDTDWTAWEIYSTSKVVTLPDDSIDYPDYRVGVIFKNSYGETEVVYMDIEYKAPEPPTDPYIIINGGDTITNSFDVTFTLDCDNANEMRFQIADGIYLDWVSYDTTYSLILNESNPNYPNYEVGVTFKNIHGESEEVFDSIIYRAGDGNGDEVDDYTITYVLVGVLVGLLAIVGIFMFLRKRKGISVSKRVK